jgi:sugar phosphate isomerase/epimerase
MTVVPTRPFEPKFMKVGVLTAALQELTPRAVRDPDPDRAIEDWVEFARELDAGYIQLSAALHPSETDVPPEAMLDPVANTLDLRKPFCKDRARRVEAALKANGVGLSDIGYFDNMLHHDAAVRRKKHEFMVRVFDAAVLLGADAVCGFVGRNQQHSMDQNLVDFEAEFVPLLKAAKSRGLTYRVEPCPMPGWTSGDNWHNNIGYTPGTWIALHRVCEKHGVGDQFRIHYDPSHAILMGQDTRSIFQYLKDTGYNFLVGGFHVKGQVIDSKGVAAWGYGGQTVERGDWVGGQPSENAAHLVAEPHGRLARPPARRARAAAARRGQHAPGRRARVSESAPPGSRTSQADPPGVDRVRAPHRRSGRLHVRAAARGAGVAGHRDPGRGTTGVSLVMCINFDR